MAVVRTLLLRHAVAGSRDGWAGDDRDRPLTVAGLRQVDALVELLAPSAPVRVLTSPYVRCRQTVESLAAKVGLPLEEVPWLGADVVDRPDAPAVLARHVRAVVTGTPAPVDDRPVVLCSHGEVIAVALAAVVPPDVLHGARALGAPEPPGDKGAWWDLEWDGPAVRSARYVPAPPA